MFGEGGQNVVHQLRRLSSTQAGPGACNYVWIQVHCPVPAENPLEGIIQHEDWDTEGRVFSKAAGFIFCGYECGESPGHIRDNYRLIEYGEGGEPAADCKWRLQGCTEIRTSESERLYRPYICER